MTTIIQYTDQKSPLNDYPNRIISPTRSSSCCFSEMEDVGPVQQAARWEFRYRRCRSCGFAVRVVLREQPDAALIAELRQTLEVLFSRGR